MLSVTVIIEHGTEFETDLFQDLSSIISITLSTLTVIGNIDLKSK